MIPQNCSGVLVQDGCITLSREHTAYQWLEYPEAYDLLRYNGNRIALWELISTVHKARGKYRLSLTSFLYCIGMPKRHLDEIRAQEYT